MGGREGDGVNSQQLLPLIITTIIFWVGWGGAQNRVWCYIPLLEAVPQL